jgi:hypothetical protein
MMTTMLIHAAIWTHFAVTHPANTHFDVWAATKDAASSEVSIWRWRDDPAPEPPEEKVILRETTMSEKFGLDVEDIARPDKEIAAVQEDASRLTSSIDLRANAKGPAWEVPTFYRNPRLRTNWNEQFSFSWDDDGFHFGGKYYPCAWKADPKDSTQIITFFIGTNR